MRSSGVASSSSVPVGTDGSSSTVSVFAGEWGPSERERDRHEHYLYSIYEGERETEILTSILAIHNMEGRERGRDLNEHY